MRISVEPFMNEPGKTLHYFDMSARGKLCMETLVLDTIDDHYMGVPISIDVEHSDEYTAREVTMLALIGLSDQPPLLPGFRYSGSKTGRNSPHYSAFTVLGTEGLGPLGRIHGLGLAFRTGLFHADPEAEQKRDKIFNYMESVVVERFVGLSPLIAEGHSNLEIGEMFGRSQGWANRNIREVTTAFGTNKAGLVMIAGGLGLLSNGNSYHEDSLV